MQLKYIYGGQMKRVKSKVTEITTRTLPNKDNVQINQCE